MANTATNRSVIAIQWYNSTIYEYLEASKAINVLTDSTYTGLMGRSWGVKTPAKFQPPSISPSLIDFSHRLEYFENNFNAVPVFGHEQYLFVLKSDDVYFTRIGSKIHNAMHFYLKIRNRSLEPALRTHPPVGRDAPLLVFPHSVLIVVLPLQCSFRSMRSLAYWIPKPITGKCIGLENVELHSILHTRTLLSSCVYEARSINKLQNGAIPSVLKIGKIRNIRFVGSLILNMHTNFHHRHNCDVSWQ